MVTLHTVLLIDDDEVNNLICSKVIKKQNFSENIISCLSARQGLQYLEDAIQNDPQKLPDLILLDINMPVIDGWGFLEKYKDLVGLFGKKIILVMLSSSMFSDDINRALSYKEVSDYIAKPLTAVHIQHISEKFFEGPVQS
jgi:CheY-like chemotaxis protein